MEITTDSQSNSTPTRTYDNSRPPREVRGLVNFRKFPGTIPASRLVNKCFSPQAGPNFLTVIHFLDLDNARMLFIISLYLPRAIFSDHKNPSYRATLFSSSWLRSGNQSDGNGGNTLNFLEPSL